MSKLESLQKELYSIQKEIENAQLSHRKTLTKYVLSLEEEKLNINQMDKEKMEKEIKNSMEAIYEYKYEELKQRIESILQILFNLI